MKKGFSLIEVLAATTILAGVLFSVTRIISASYLYASKVDNIYLGTELARLKLHDVEVKIEEDGLPEMEFEEEGEFDEEAYDGFKWKYSIKRVFIHLPDFTGSNDGTEGQQEQAASMLSLAKGNIEDFFKERIRKLTLIVYWGKGVKESEKIEFTMFLTTEGTVKQFQQFQGGSSGNSTGNPLQNSKLFNPPANSNLTRPPLKNNRMNLGK
jgi:prepilin-type N-terminal cleavage/methylation domain-containing protein